MLTVQPYFALNEPECRLYHADTLTADCVEPDSVDLIITSPPYNVEVVYGTHRDDLSYAEYLDFCEAWLRRCYEWLRPDGRFCLNIPLWRSALGSSIIPVSCGTRATFHGAQRGGRG